jgi:outer membrane protein assembly factor BamB
VPQPPAWPTFGGDRARGKHAPGEVDPAGRPLWSYSLHRQNAEREWLGAGRLRPADDSRGLLAYHPIVVGNEVFVQLDAQGNSYVVALDLKTGQRLWEVDFSRGLSPNESDGAEPPPRTSDAHVGLGRHVGISRHALSAAGHKLFGRLGSPVTQPSPRRASTWLAKDQGFLIGLDLRAEGKPLEGFPIRPPSGEWTFEGTPVADHGTLYVVMRRTSGAQSQLHLAAFELPTAPLVAATTDGDEGRPAGRLKWRTRVCSSQTALGGELDQLTHLLVSLASDRVYLNTNAGAVAAASAADGKLLWVVTYPRAPAPASDSSRVEPHWFRDLTPCLAWRDLLFVAPADCEQLFALDAASGELVWEMPRGLAGDAVHLLGVQADVLVVSGDSLYWIDARTGRLLAQFPRTSPRGPAQAAAAPRGFGRGVLAGSHVWFPTRESICVFDAAPQHSGFGYEPRLAREIPLLPRGVTGGNLVIAGGVLLIATGDRLVAFGE